MINLPSPITYQRPPMGTVESPVHFQPQTINKLDFNIVANEKRKIISARFILNGVVKPTPLFEGAAFDALNGTYTKAAIEARITELLGDNPVEFIESLFPAPLANQN